MVMADLGMVSLVCGLILAAFAIVSIVYFAHSGKGPFAWFLDKVL